ncbi:MAG: phosphopentomutase [Bacteroidetes bacterium]|nr:MAG: phosphopentomutase [Bacteroidota bacterium]
MTRRRAIIIVLDSVGIGESPDAKKYGDVGANTLGHIAEFCAEGKADSYIRKGPLNLPNLQRWGIGEAASDSSRKEVVFAQNIEAEGAYGYAQEISAGKDTPSGHWEICGLPVPFEWGLFPNVTDCFPKNLLQELISKGNLKGTLSNSHASGTEVLIEYGEEHMRTGMPICYTSSDSVFQIAAHESTFGLQRLYDLCDIARDLVDPLNIGRVIARPFKGNSPSNFERTSNRKDLTTPPHAPTLLDKVKLSGLPVVSIGKISDIFAGKGISYTLKAPNNMELVDVLLKEMCNVKEGLLFVNLVDFDSKFGHRRDVIGYAHALEQFDKRLPEIEALLSPNDLVLITADHGCDPTWAGTDHTREFVPVLFNGPKVMTKNLGLRQTFADMGATIAHHLNTEPLQYGSNCDI